MLGNRNTPTIESATGSNPESFIDLSRRVDQILLNLQRIQSPISNTTPVQSQYPQTMFYDSQFDLVTSPAPPPVLENNSPNLHNTVSQLVNQNSETMRLLTDIHGRLSSNDMLVREHLNSATNLLSHNFNRSDDINRLKQDNLLLRQNLENLVNAVKSAYNM